MKINTINTTLCVSIGVEQKKYLIARAMSPSRVLRRAINELRDQTSKQDLLNVIQQREEKIKKFATMYGIALGMIDGLGHREALEKELNKLGDHVSGD